MNIFKESFTKLQEKIIAKMHNHEWNRTWQTSIYWQKSRNNKRFMEMENMSMVDVREIALKWSTKAEVYKVLTITGNVYLPPVYQINSNFIRNVLWGEKLVRWLSHSVVYCCKSSKDDQCFTHWRSENLWSFEVCKRALKHRSIHAGILLRKISIKEMDL